MGGLMVMIMIPTRATMDSQPTVNFHPVNCICNAEMRARKLCIVKFRWSLSPLSHFFYNYKIYCGIQNNRLPETSRIRYFEITVNRAVRIELFMARVLCRVPYGVLEST